MAADLTQSFVGKHVEKMVLAAAALIFVVSLVWFVFMREPQGRDLVQVEGLVEGVAARAYKPTIVDALTKEERVWLGIDKSVTTAAQFAQALNGLPATWDAVAKMVEGMPEIVVKEVIAEEVNPPQQILAVEDVHTVWGRGVTSDSVEMALAKVEVKAGTLSDIVWAGSVGTFNLTEQLRQYALPRKFISPQSPVTITKVELRRRERQPDGAWSDWKAVPASVPAEVADALPTLPADPDDKLAVRAWGVGAMKAQAEIRHPPFYQLVLADPEGKTVESGAGPIDNVAKPDPAVLETAEEPPADAKADDRKKPATPKRETETNKTGEDLPRSPWDIKETSTKKPKKTGTEPEEQTTAPADVYATVWVNDATVQPGKTYQYQMRLAVLNPVWSLPEVKDATARWTLELAGPWSDMGEEVTIPGLVQFYFVGTFGGRVNLELHRWIHGQWIVVPSAPTLLGAPVSYTKKRHRIEIGGPKRGKPEEIIKDVDLSPQALIVDVIKGFPYKPQGGNRSISTNVLVYADGRGAVRERIEWEDRQRAAEARMRRKEAAAAVPETRRTRTKPSSTRPKKTPPRSSTRKPR